MRASSRVARENPHSALKSRTSRAICKSTDELRVKGLFPGTISLADGRVGSVRPGCCVVVAMASEEGGIVRHQATLHAMRLQRVGGKFYTVGLLEGFIRDSPEYKDPNQKCDRIQDLRHSDDCGCGFSLQRLKGGRFQKAGQGALRPKGMTCLFCGHPRRMIDLVGEGWKLSEQRVRKLDIPPAMVNGWEVSQPA